MEPEVLQRRKIFCRHAYFAGMPEYPYGFLEPTKATLASTLVAPAAQLSSFCVFADHSLATFLSRPFYSFEGLICDANQFFRCKTNLSELVAS